MSDNNCNSGRDLPPAGTLPDTFFLPSNSLEATINFNDVKCAIDNYVKLKEGWHAMRKAFVNAAEERLNCANCGQFHGYDADQNSLLWAELFEDLKKAEFGFELFEGDQGGPEKEITLEKVHGWLKKWDKAEELYDKECRGSACGQWLEGFVPKQQPESEINWTIRTREKNRDWVEEARNEPKRHVADPDPDGWHNVDRRTGSQANNQEQGEDKKGNGCYNCGEEGHRKNDCPYPPTMECYNCYQRGHSKTECTNERVMKCSNCLKIGHHFMGCPLPKDWMKYTCRICKQRGHGPKICPQKDVLAETGGGGYGGGYGNPTRGDESARGGWVTAQAGGESNEWPSGTANGWDTTGMATGAGTDGFQTGETSDWASPSW